MCFILNRHLPKVVNLQTPGEKYIKIYVAIDNIQKHVNTADSKTI